MHLSHVPLIMRVCIVGKNVYPLPAATAIQPLQETPALHEALTNVHRHANACSVDVEIMCIEKKLFSLFQTMARACTGMYFNGCAPGSQTGLALPECERG